MEKLKQFVHIIPVRGSDKPYIVYLTRQPTKELAQAKVFLDLATSKFQCIGDIDTYEVIIGKKGNLHVEGAKKDKMELLVHSDILYEMPST